MGTYTVQVFKDRYEEEVLSELSSSKWEDIERYAGNALAKGGYINLSSEYGSFAISPENYEEGRSIMECIASDDAKRLWESLEDVPFDEEMRVETDFMQFPAGTDREDIWVYFDKVYDGGVHELLYGYSTPEPDHEDLAYEISKKFKQEAEKYLYAAREEGVDWLIQHALEVSIMNDLVFYADSELFVKDLCENHTEDAETFLNTEDLGQAIIETYLHDQQIMECPNIGMFDGYLELLQSAAYDLREQKAIILQNARKLEERDNARKLEERDL